MTEKKPGRPFKYPFDKLQVGEASFHPVAVGQKVSTLRRNIQNMARRYRMLSAAIFELKSEENGVRILRTA